jgi:multidrug resistance efflux pump
MSAPFQRSLRALAGEGGRSFVAALAVAAALGVLWSTWFVRAQLGVYAVTLAARVEVDRAAYPIEAAVGGRVVASHLALDREVTAGEPLLELDAEALQMKLGEARAQLEGLPAQLAALERQMEAKLAALREHRRAAPSRTLEAEAHRRELEALAGYVETEAKRAEALRDGGLLSAAELEHSRSEGLARRAAVDVERAAGERRATESFMAERTLEADLAELARLLETLKTQRAALEASARSVAHDVELRTLRAPVAGRLGEIMPLQVGSFVREGARVAAVVPRRGLLVVAEFEPALALGRVRAGQLARLRLDGFPWVQFGAVPLRVTRVASEVREGKVRVELALEGDTPAALPLQHGLPGMVEIEVERLRPIELVVRAAGRALRGSGL